MHQKTTPFIACISDIHLSEHNPDITRLFKHYLTHIAPQAEALYILGDLFDSWVGDDAATDYHRSIITLLKQTSDQTPLFLVPGNRDFLLGHAFYNATGITKLDDISTHQFFNTRVTLFHGDSFCTADISYQILRRIFRCQWIQYLFLKLPVDTRRKIGQQARNTSRKATRKKPATQFNIDHDAVLKTLKQSHSNAAVYGHIHRIEHTPYPNDNTFSISLTDWTNKQGNHIQFFPDGTHVFTYISLA